MRGYVTRPGVEEELKDIASDELKQRRAISKVGPVVFLLAIPASVLLLWLLPLAPLWALNALFGLGIPYTLKTWTAAVIMLLLVGVHSSR